MELTNNKSRSIEWIQSRIPNEIQAGYKEDKNFKLYRKFKDNDGNWKRYVSFAGDVIHLDGIVWNQWGGKAFKKDGTTDSNAKKFLTNSAFIVGETDGGKSWKLKLGLNDKYAAVPKCFVNLEKHGITTYEQLSKIHEKENVPVEMIIRKKLDNGEIVKFHIYDKPEMYKENYLGEKEAQYLADFFYDLTFIALKVVEWVINSSEVFTVTGILLLKEIFELLRRNENFKNEGRSRFLKDKEKLSLYKVRFKYETFDPDEYSEEDITDSKIIDLADNI